MLLCRNPEGENVQTSGKMSSTADARLGDEPAQPISGYCVM